MKKILYFYPENPLSLDQGNNQRANTLLKYFKAKGYEVDLVGQHLPYYKDDDINKLKEEGLILNGWLLKKNVLNIHHFIFKILPEKLKKGIYKIFWKSRYKSNLDLNMLKKGYKEQFEMILQKKNYDYIIITYTNWSSLIKNSQYLKNSKLIIDTHDFMTSQFSTQQHFDIGYYIKKEFESLQLFDNIWAISIEEHYLFSQFLGTDIVKLIPHGVKDNSNYTPKHEIDLLYIASDNKHNINSINWFFEKVYPLLSKNIKITTIGKICKHIPDLKNVTKIDFAENLDEYYQKSKVAICPMLSGTGLKIKVVEALSYNIPVVCNPRGVDGLLNKTNNGCLVSNTEIDFSENITRLLSDEAFYHEKKLNAKHFFQQTLCIEHVKKELDNEFK